MNDWPHQTYAVAEAETAMFLDRRRICITSPTGGGKSLIQRRIMEWGRPTVLLCNRVMLLEQLAKGLDEHGMPFDVQASGYAPTQFATAQLGMIQTIERRWRNGERALPPAEIVLLDEAHNEKGDRCCSILNEYEARGATIVGFTATPIDIGHMFSHLIQAGCVSDLFKCGALIPAHTFAPDEPDMRGLKASAKGIIQFREEVKEVMLRVIFGRVIQHYHRLNPDQRPAILFAPGVDESRWFCEQFNNAGIPWSHIDSQSIVINGEEMPATKETRELLREASISGRTKGVSNRFVLREGIDWPHLYHGIFACTFGSVTSYLQAGGRLLRNHESLDHVIIQDHGGNFWRHDSLNADRHWSLDDSDKSIREKHDEIFRTKAKPEPIVCPKCAKVRPSGVRCPQCGFAYEGRKRMVVQTNGTLREVKGDVFKPRRVNQSPDAHKKWIQCYFRCLKSGRTFNQARALYQLENRGYVPGNDFPLVPRYESDWSMHIQDVPRDRLTPYASTATI